MPGLNLKSTICKSNTNSINLEQLTIHFISNSFFSRNPGQNSFGNISVHFVESKSRNSRTYYHKANEGKGTKFNKRFVYNLHPGIAAYFFSQYLSTYSMRLS